MKSDSMGINSPNPKNIISLYPANSADVGSNPDSDKLLSRNIVIRSSMEASLYSTAWRDRLEDRGVGQVEKNL